MASDVWGYLGLIVLSVLLYGVFDCLAVALRAAQKSRLLQWQEERRYGATAALLIRDTPGQFVMTLHIGLTCTGMAAAMVWALTVGQGPGSWCGRGSDVVDGALALALVLCSLVMLVFGCPRYCPAISRACRVWVGAAARDVDPPVPGATDGANGVCNRGPLDVWTASSAGVYPPHPDYGGRRHDHGAGRGGARNL